jgi:hypothetical protein
MSEKTPKAHPAGPGRGNVWNPSEEQRQRVRWLAAAGATEVQVAQIIGVNVKTLKARCPEELANGPELANLQLMGKLYSKAMGSGVEAKDGDTACLIYLAKVRMHLYDRPPAFAPVHPNDIPSTPTMTREVISAEVTYRWTNDPAALGPPPADRLPQPTVDAEARPA